MQEIEFGVVHNSVEGVEYELLHVEEEEELPHHRPYVRAGLQSHQDIVSDHCVQVYHRNSEQ